MNSHEVTISLHLYPSNIECKIPATTIYGEDLEFNGNYRNKVIYSVQDTVFKTCPGLHLDQEASISSILLVRLVYTDDYENIHFIVNLLTDSNPWPQKDVALCEERDIKFKEGCLGQRWWVHHIDLPDNTTLTGDLILEHECKCISDAIQHNLVSYLNQVESQHVLNSLTSDSKYRKNQLNQFIDSTVAQ